MHNCLLQGWCWEPKPPQKFRKSHWCVPFTATFSKRRKIGALWSERCDAEHTQGPGQLWLKMFTLVSCCECCLYTNTHIHLYICIYAKVLRICIHIYLDIHTWANKVLEEARKLTSSREILLWMTPSEAPKALQASECSELLDPMRASCWIFAQH